MQIGSDCKLSMALSYFCTVNPPIESTHKCLSLLYKLLQNIQDDPYNKKFSIIYLSNQTISQKLLALQGVKEFIHIVGFMPVFEGGELIAYQYDPQSESQQDLQFAIYIVKQEFDSQIILELADPQMAKITNLRKQKYEEEKAYKEKLIRDFEANKREVYQNKVEQARSQQAKQNRIEADIQESKRQRELTYNKQVQQNGKQNIPQKSSKNKVQIEERPLLGNQYPEY